MLFFGNIYFLQISDLLVLFTSQLTRKVQIFGSYPSIDNLQNLSGEIDWRRVGAVIGWNAQVPSSRGGGGSDDQPELQFANFCVMPIYSKIVHEECNCKIEPDADPGSPFSQSSGPNQAQLQTQSSSRFRPAHRGHNGLIIKRLQSCPELATYGMDVPLLVNLWADVARTRFSVPFLIHSLLWALWLNVGEFQFLFNIGCPWYGGTPPSRKYEKDLFQP